MPHSFPTRRSSDLDNTGKRQAMRSKVLWFLLTASLALNVFFVAGVIWPRLMGHPYPPHGRDPVAAAAEQFKLDDRQVAALEALRQRLAERRSEKIGRAHV